VWRKRERVEINRYGDKDRVEMEKWREEGAKESERKEKN